MAKRINLEEATGDVMTDTLREFIAQAGKPIEVIAREVEIPRSTMYSMVSDGKKSKRQNMEYLQKLAHYFNCDLNVLTGGATTLQLTDQEKALIENYRRLDKETANRVSGLVESPPEPLREEEGELLSLTRKLDERGLKRLQETADDLVSSGKYKRGR